MLRMLVLALGALAATAGALIAAAGARAAGLYLLCIGAAILAGTLFERWRYRGASPRGARWERTGERFEDPTTGETLEVEYDRASGERRYVPLSASAPGR